MVSMILMGLVNRVSQKLGVESKELLEAQKLEDIKNLGHVNKTAIEIFAKIKEAQKLENKIVKKLNINLMEEIVKEDIKSKEEAIKIAVGEEVIGRNGFVNEPETKKRKKKELSDPSINFKSVSFDLEGPGL